LRALDDTQFMKNGTWHPAVAMLVLADQPDELNFGGAMAKDCKEKQNVCWLRAVLSAMDGVLAAEKHKGMTNVTSVNLTVAWSMGTYDSIDGVVSRGIGYFGFRDVLVGVRDPSVANYAPHVSQKELASAFATRWTNGLNVASSWDFIQGKIYPVYEDPKYEFAPTPWFISGFGTEAKKSSDISIDLKTMSAAADNSYFLGASIAQFQQAYQMTGTDSGLFNLGAATGPENSTQQVCEEDVRTGSPVCSSWPVNCLEENNGLATAVAGAWKGTAMGRGMCKLALEELVI